MLNLNMEIIIKIFAFKESVFDCIWDEFFGQKLFFIIFFLFSFSIDGITKRNN